jgi:para-nitrobenzyl esterase
VPLLMGTADTEATFHFASDSRQLQLTTKQVMARLKTQFGLDDVQAEGVMAAYRQESPPRTASQVLMAVITDTLYRIPIIRAAEAKAAANGAPVYMYNFTWRSPADGGMWGTPHASDIPFAFGTTGKARSLTGPGGAPVEVSKNLMAAFVAFARTGDPANARMPAWKPYDAVARTSMKIDVTCEAVEDYRRADRLAGSQLRLEPFNRAALFTYRD